MVVDLKDCATRGGALLFWKRIGFDGTADDCRDGAGQRMLLNAQAPSCIEIASRRLRYEPTAAVREGLHEPDVANVRSSRDLAAEGCEGAAVAGEGLHVLDAIDEAVCAVPAGLPSSGSHQLTGREEPLEGGSRSVKEAPRRRAFKEALGGKDGLLVGRGEFRRDFGHLVSGGRTECLADAIAHALEADKGVVRNGIGSDHSFKRAVSYIKEAFPEWVLVKNTASFMCKGGPELALLNASTGRFVLSLSYVHNGARQYHCAYFDAGFRWKRDDFQRGAPLCGRGVLKDNQSDVPVHLAMDGDRASADTARAFFAAPYASIMRIEAIYELVPRGGAKRQKCESSALWQVQHGGIASVGGGSESQAPGEVRAMETGTMCNGHSCESGAAYEALRLANIKRNNEMLRHLGLLDTLTACDMKDRRRCAMKSQRRRTVHEGAPQRCSPRLVGRSSPSYVYKRYKRPHIKQGHRSRASQPFCNLTGAGGWETGDGMYEMELNEMNEHLLTLGNACHVQGRCRGQPRRRARRRRQGRRCQKQCAVWDEGDCASGHIKPPPLLRGGGQPATEAVVHVAVEGSIGVRGSVRTCVLPDPSSVHAGCASCSSHTTESTPTGRQVDCACSARRSLCAGLACCGAAGGGRCVAQCWAAAGDVRRDLAQARIPAGRPRLWCGAAPRSTAPARCARRCHRGLAIQQSSSLRCRRPVR